MRNADSLSDATDQDRPLGLVYALTAYGLWGGLPIYMKLLAHIPPAEIVVHRVIWSVPIAALVLVLLRRTDALMQALRSPQMLLMGCVTAGLISINWGVYIWAIATDRALDAALGYYINPLFSIFLAAVVLRERLSKAQMVAILLATVAVAILALDAGRLPIIALALPITWGFYALAKKSLPIGPNQGFLLEVLILTPPAVGYLIYLSFAGQSHFALNLTQDTVMLFGCGIVTAAPLMFYANGAKLLRLSTIGILQYVAPTLIMIVAVFVFKEEFGTTRLMAFSLIWLALIIYTLSMFRQIRGAPG